MRIAKKTLAGIATAALLVGAPAASAATSAQSGYSTPGGEVQTQIETSQPPTVVETATSSNAPAEKTQSRDTGSLPFTGLDVVLVVAAGGILLALGLGMRRMARPTSVA
jgi:hypothetical protein